MLLGMILAMSLTANAEGSTTTITPGTDDPKTGTGTMTITLIIKGDPAATDFDVTLPTSLTYEDSNGSRQEYCDRNGHDHGRVLQGRYKGRLCR